MDTNASLVSHSTAVISTLDGVTTVLVAFIFVCLIYPSLVKHRPQYHAALAAIVGILLLHTLTLMFSGSEGFTILMAVLSGMLQIVALLLLVLSVGGLSARELAGDMSRAYEVMRRGESTKEVIIPIGDQGQPPKPPQSDSSVPLE
jgi:peptidoglycan/LPS O-acetylase OafA/YrhL